MLYSQVIDLFKEIDRNGDGELSHAEFLRGLRCRAPRAHARMHGQCTCTHV